MPFVHHRRYYTLESQSPVTLELPSSAGDLPDRFSGPLFNNPGWVAHHSYRTARLSELYDVYVHQAEASQPPPLGQMAYPSVSDQQGLGLPEHVVHLYDEELHCDAQPSGKSLSAPSTPNTAKFMSIPSIDSVHMRGSSAPPNPWPLPAQAQVVHAVGERRNGHVGEASKCLPMRSACSSERFPHLKSTPLRPKPKDDPLSSYQTRRYKNPGRKTSLPQTPYIMARNARRRERYRSKLSPEQQEQYDRGRPGGIVNLQASHS